MNEFNDLMIWWEEFDNTEIVIKTKNKEIEFDIDRKALPHLLGVHYADNNLRGRELVQLMKEKTDAEIFNMILRKNPSKKKYVEDRLKYFRYFMENLDKAFLVQKNIVIL